MKNIYLIVGKSGSGKDTIVNALCEDYGYKRLVSYTTRPQRSDPNDAKSHIFVDIEDYRRDKDNGRIVAETFYNGHFYWATKKQVDESDLYIIDVPGVKSIKERYFGKPAVVIAVEADDSVRTRRMVLRGDNSVNVAKRMALDEEEFRELPSLTDYVVLSEDSGIDIPVGMLARSIHRTIQNHEEHKTSSDTTAIKLWLQARKAPDKMTVLSDVMKAVDGYKDTDMVPVSGRLLRDIATALGNEI